MRKRTREHEAGSPDSDQPTKMFSKYEVQGLLQQEVHSAMKQSESRMESLLERVQLLECEPKYDLAIRKLEAHIKKVKRRGDAAISYVRMLGPPGVKHNQRMLGSGLVDLTETETERGLSTVDISRSDSDEEDSAENQRKTVDGFWQKMMSSKKAPDRKREKERNGKKHNSPPPPPPSPPPPPRSPLPPVLSPQVPKIEAAVVPVTRPPVMSPEGPVKTEGAVKTENTVVKTEDSSCPPVTLHVPPPSQSELASRLPPLPSTPFPSSLPLEAASYSIPQKPLVHLARIRNPAPCLVIHWRVAEEDPAAPVMDSYSIYIAQESHSSSVSPSWRNVGVVKALALPMAVTVTKYQSGTTYVIVVGKDRYGRYGPYSDIQTVLLA